MTFSPAVCSIPKKLLRPALLAVPLSSSLRHPPWPRPTLSRPGPILCRPFRWPFQWPTSRSSSPTRGGRSTSRSARSRRCARSSSRRSSCRSPPATGSRRWRRPLPLPPSRRRRGAARRDRGVGGADPRRAEGRRVGGGLPGSSAFPARTSGCASAASCARPPWPPSVRSAPRTGSSPPRSRWREPPRPARSRASS